MWLKAKKLTLNINKSNLVLFRETRTKVINNINIKIGKEIVKQKDYTKYVGLLIDNKLNWEQHIKYLNLKVTKGIGIITKLRRYVSKPTLRMLYYVFVQLHTDYGLSLWGSAFKIETKPIAKNIKKAVRKMLFKKKQSSNRTIVQINILNFEKLKEYAVLQFMWKLSNNEIANNIKSLLYPRKRFYVSC